MADDPFTAAAGDVFTVAALDDGRVRLQLDYPGNCVELEFPPESAQWLAYELVKAARLPWPPPLRLARRAAVPDPGEATGGPRHFADGGD